MPSDKSGKFHLSSQRAHAADRAGMKAPLHETAAPMGEMDSPADGPHTTLHDHQDGSFHTEGHDGEHVEHPSIDHAMEHMKAKHGGHGSAHSPEHDMGTEVY